MNFESTKIDIDAGNVLLERIQERTTDEWFADLHYDPRERWGRPFGTVPFSYTEELEHFNVPTSNGVLVACALSTRLIAGLRRRDPRDRANKRRLFQMAELSRQDLGKELKKMPWFADGASGAILRGPTGCAKSHIVTSFLRGIPQWLEHGPNVQCGWAAFKQLVYLRVFMPSDHSRSGLLAGIVAEVDSILDEQYSVTFSKIKTIEKQLLYVLQILTVHRCGMLLIEEAQDRNFRAEVWSTEFTTVFLRVMNCGIPLVLIGNPFAFDHILAFSQDLRRLTKGGCYECLPAFAADDPDWTEHLVPGIGKWTIFDKPDTAFTEDPKLLYERTGGVHAFLAAYRKETLLAAMYAKADCVDRLHMEIAWGSPVMKGLHSLIDGYARKDVKILGLSKDQPIAYLERQWAEQAVIREAIAAVRAEMTQGVRHREPS